MKNAINILKRMLVIGLSIMMMAGSMTDTVYAMTVTDDVIVSDEESVTLADEIPDSDDSLDAQEFVPDYAAPDDAVESCDSLEIENLPVEYTVGNPGTEYKIDIVNTAAGKAESDKSSSPVNATVTLTLTPAAGFLANGVTVVDEDGNEIEVTGGTWTDNNTASFTMPEKNVVVIPRFTDILTAEGGLYVNMKKNDIKEITVPKSVRSFKAYDDGGKDGNISGDSESQFLFIAPEGCRLRLSGRSKIGGTSSSYLRVYDGESVYAEKVLDMKTSTQWVSLPEIISTGNSLYINIFY